MNPSVPLFRPDNSATQRWVVPAMTALALLTLSVRIAAVFLLPNYDGDAYCYLEKATELHSLMLAGTFHFANLFHFWLPLYPLTVALVSFLLPGVGIMLVGKLVAAVAGLAVCFLVYRLLLALTRLPPVAAAGALLVALDPWQVLYSSNTMTEIPFEALVLGALERAVRRRWTAAACLLAAAGLLRIEAWPLAALVPLAAFVVDRKINLVPVAAVFFAPALWSGINYAAMGDAFAFFNIRHGYVAAYLAAEPARAHFSRENLSLDGSNLLQGANLAFLAGTLAALAHLIGGCLFRRGSPARKSGPTAWMVGAVYLFLLAFLVLAYLTHSQPVIWTRYGLIYQPLGVCLTLWWLAEAARPPWRWLAVPVLALYLAAHSIREWRNVGAAGETFAWHRRAAARLAVLAPACTYCDSPVIRVESGLPRAALRDRYQLRRDQAGFLEDMRRQKVDCLVFVPLLGGSTPARLFPELLNFRSAHGFEPVARFAPSPADWRAPVLIYRFVPTGISPPRMTAVDVPSEL